jgi:hypothetical protein
LIIVLIEENIPLRGFGVQNAFSDFPSWNFFERNSQASSLFAVRGKIPPHLAQSGVDPYAVQRLMGHKTFTITQRYANHYSESLRVGIKALEASRVEWGKIFSTNLAQSA